jgi:glycosyltransferase involved in cell wall biosynthesis
MDRPGRRRLVRGVTVASESLVSVVLPVCDSAATLGRALDSLSAQTWPQWEAVVVENGSADGTAEVAAAAAARDPRIKLLRLPARGLVPALNAGLAAARGAWIARLDADDTAAPTRLERQVRFLQAPENRGIGLAGCFVEFGGDRTAQSGYARHVDWLNTLATPEAIALHRFVESPLAHPSVMFRRELVSQFGGYHDGDFPEDYELWLRWLDAGVRMAKVPEFLVRWSDPPGRLSRTDPRYAPEAFFRIKAPWLAREVGRAAAGRRVWVWGAGRPTRKRAAWLEAAGVRVEGFVDIDPRKISPALGGTGRPVLSPAQLPGPQSAYVAVYVAARGARELIAVELERRGFRVGRDYVLAA